MAKKQNRAKPGKSQGLKKKKVTFSFPSVEAQKVNLLGDFNNWNPDKHPMTNDGPNGWKRTMQLAPGRYEYKFQVDGQWQNDPSSSQRVVNCFESQNRDHGQSRDQQQKLMTGVAPVYC